MKNRLRITGDFIIDTVLMCIILSTGITALYGCILGFPEGFPQRIDTNKIMNYVFILMVIYVITYAVWEKKIIDSKVDELYKEMTSGYQPKNKLDTSNPPCEK